MEQVDVLVVGAGECFGDSLRTFVQAFHSLR
jgi:hypothetical protein